MYNFADYASTVLSCILSSMLITSSDMSPATVSDTLQTQVTVSLSASVISQSGVMSVIIMLTTRGNFYNNTSDIF